MDGWKDGIDRWTNGWMDGWVDRWAADWMGGQMVTEWIATTQGSGRRETLVWRLRVSPMKPHCLGLIPSDQCTDHHLLGLCKGPVFSMYDVNKSRAVVRIM